MNPPVVPCAWRRVVVPTDFSSCSLAALKSAAHLLEASGTAIILLHVTEPVHEGLRIQTEDIHVRMRHAAETQLKELADEYYPGQEDKVTLRVVEGRPAETICATALEEEAEAIIIPTHGHSGLKHMLVGSVAEKVVRQAHCDVLVVRQ